MRSFTTVAILLCFFVTVHPSFAQEQEEWYDYCAYPKTDDKLNSYRADKNSVKPKRLEMPILQKSQSAGEIPKRMITIGEGDSEKKYFRVCLIPIGYEEGIIDTRMRELTKVLQGAFKNVQDMSFSFVSRSYEIDIFYVEHLVIIGDKIRDRIQTGLKRRSCNALYFVLNTEEYLGSAYPDKMQAAGEGGGNFVFYTAIHEIGHLIGLDDGYESYYKPHWLPNTELFFDIHRLHKRVAKVYDELVEKPKTVQAGICSALPLYRFKGAEKTVMAHPTKNWILRACKEPLMAAPLTSLGIDCIIFNDIQIAVMNKFVQAYLVKKK